MAKVNNVHPLSPAAPLPADKPPGDKRRQPEEKKPEQAPGDVAQRPDDTARIDEFA